MPLIPAVEQKPETKVVSFPLEVRLLADLKAYIKFVNSPNVGYVLNRSVEYLVTHDRDFLKSRESKPVVVAATR